MPKGGCHGQSQYRKGGTMLFIVPWPKRVVDRMALAFPIAWNLRMNLRGKDSEWFCSILEVFNLLPLQSLLQDVCVPGCFNFCLRTLIEVWPCLGGRKEGSVRKGNKSFIPYPSVHTGHSFVADCLHEMRQNQNSLGWFGLLVRSKAVGDAKDQRIYHDNQTSPYISVLMNLQ